MKLNFFAIIIYFILIHPFNNLNSKEINKINIIGNERISDETIIMFSNYKNYEIINEEVLNEILKNLYKSKFFRDVSLNLEDNVLNISVVENPIIENISYSGIKSNSLKENILSNISLKERSSYDLNLLEKDKIIIKNNLKNLGYYFSEIEVLVIDKKDNKVDIIYNINLKEKSKIKKITFVGNKIFKESKLKSLIVSEEYKFWKIISGKKYLNENIISIDERLLRNFYLNKGYYNVNINSSFAKLITDNEFELIFNIDPGEKIVFNNLTLKLPIDFEKSNFSKLEYLFESLKGQVYSVSKIEKILDEIDRISSIEEYSSIKASVSEEIISDKINLDFVIEEEDKFFVEKINILGNNITRENVIRNQFEIDEGDPFNEILLNKTVNNIKNLNFFRSVKNNVIDLPGGNKIIDLFIEEKPTGEISAGAGFGTGGATFLFGIKENNYLGKGISVDANITASETSLKGILSFVNPNLYNSDKSGYFTLETTETDKLSLYGYKSNKSGFMFGTGFEYLDDLYLNLGTSAYYEVIETNSTASALRQKQKGNYFDNFAKFSVNYDKRNQKFQTSDGFRSIYSLELPVVSENNTLTNSYTYEVYKELYENNISTFSFSIKNAISITGENIKVSERLYVPSRKLRGFETGKIGPKDGNDFIGGNYFSSINFTSTLPQILPNSQNTDFTVFFDAANLWGVDYNESLNINDDIRSAIGLGLDWYTPVGPLSLSFSQPITKAATDITETFRFNIGTTF